MSIMRFAQFVFEPATGDLLGGDRVVRLRPKTAHLLAHFLEHPQKPLTRDQIFDAVWPDRIVTDNTLMQSVRELRAALDDAAAVPRFIETVHGRGYRWIGPPPAETKLPADHETVATTWRGRLMSRGAIRVAGGIVALLLILALWPLVPGPSGSSVDQDIERAQNARAQGDPELARRYYEAALIRSSDHIGARVGLATMLYETGDWDRAWNLTNETIASPGAMSRQYAELDLVAGEIAFSRGHLDLAEARFAAARDRSSQNFTPVIHAAALNGLSQVYADQGRIMEYLAISAEVVDPLLVSAQVEAFAEGLLSAGSMVHPRFDENWSLPRLQRALAVFEEIGDTRGVARAHTALGSNLALNNVAREQHLQEAARLYRSARYLPGEMNVLLQRASFEIERFNADSAEEYATRGLELSTALDAPRLHADFVFRHGLALMASAEHMPSDERVERINAAMTVFHAADAEYSGLGIVLDGLAPRLHAAIARLDAGDAAGALADFQDLDHAYHNLPFPPGELGARLGLAAALARLGRRADAELILAEIEHGLPRAVPVTTSIRTSFLAPQDDVPATSLFAIIITAERELADADRPSD